MLYFDSDYNNGMHPDILQHFCSINGEFTATYGFDVYSDSAKARIWEACADQEADIFFLGGGTQTNSTVIDGMLKPWQGVVAATTGHINVHESGAVEYTGHKVLTLPEHDGKICADELRSLFETYAADETREHMVEPGLVYISFPTETGTLYCADELDAIYSTCKEFGAGLFIDGARMAYGLGADTNDVTLPFLAAHCDAFYIGGTKCGAICGEAVVFPRGGAPSHFFTHVKQHGALFAKGRLVGMQFDTLFTDGLYFKIGTAADALAMRLQQIMLDSGVATLGSSSRTNQQFFVLSHEVIDKLKKEVVFEKWCSVDEEHDLCRFVTSWATSEADLNRLEEILRS